MAAHCTCMAGLGETCSHVAAMLYKIEAEVRKGLTHVAPTDMPCKWNQNFTENVTPARVCNIKFYSEESNVKFSKKKKEKKIPHLSDDQKKQFMTNIESTGKKCVALSLFGEFTYQFVTPPSTPQAKLPPPLYNFYDVANKELSNEQLEQKCTQITDNFTLTKAEIAYVEEATRNQSACSVWYDQTVGRITGSTIHSVLHTSLTKPSKSLIIKLCERNKTNMNVPALKWGRKMKIMHLNATNLSCLENN